MSEKLWKTLGDRQMTLGPARRRSPGRRHWRLARDENEIAWLVFDRHKAAVNTVDEEVLEELDKILEKLEEAPPQGLVLRSAKPAGFCAGADVKAFTETAGGESAEAGELERRLRRAHQIVDRLADQRFPSLAVVHGHCLGGGLELALACDTRIAVTGASLGFPEVMLGLHPGLGGTVRTPRRIDPLQAMQMMLTGKPARAEKAKRLGLVEAVTEERHVAAALTAAFEGRLRRRRRPVTAGLGTLRPLRRLAAKRMRKETAKRAREPHYPAPFALIDLWESYGGNRRKMQQEEIRSFARLLATDTAQNLVRVFFAREYLKSLAEGEGPVERVHVVGAGTMGGDIAAWCAFNGLQVTLADIDTGLIGKAVRRARDLCRRKRLSRLDTRKALDRLTPDPAGDGAAGADVVIEAVPEKVALKHEVYAQLEARMKHDAVLATNTSSIPLETLREGLKRPQRLVGLHFFNPVARMQLVEVVGHDGANKASLARARALLGKIDRLAAPVTSAPGFLVNRALMPYLVEALMLVDEGVAKETVDKAAEDFGMPMGPIELADYVGLDVCLDVAGMLAERLDGAIPEAPAWLRERVEAGDLGRKSGKGLYKWGKNGAEKSEAPAPSPELADRLVLPLLNACMTCLSQGVVDDETVVDGAMVFAAGFAPFRGGPMQYARSRGFEEVRAALASLEESHGARFAPDSGWTERG